TTLSINTNGLADLAKSNLVRTAVHSEKPHVLIIAETKTHTRASSHLHLDSEYQFYEMVGPHSSSSSRPPKWGAILGISKAFHLQLVPTLLGVLQHCVVIADVIIPTMNGIGFPHRLFAVYAPWDPGIPDIGLFWQAMTDISNSSLFPWSAIGDFNATQAACKTSSLSSSSINRSCYTSFLSESRAHNLWNDQPDQNTRQHYTYRNMCGSSIIDRAAHSIHGILEGSIEVAPYFISTTDHRPILVTITFDSPHSPASLPFHLLILPDIVIHLHTLRKQIFKLSLTAWINISTPILPFNPPSPLMSCLSIITTSSLPFCLMQPPLHLLYPLAITLSPLPPKLPHLPYVQL
ncbi:hypothetical protein L208DRAFT_1247288, partial [Tricholoma matsutake]